MAHETVNKRSSVHEKIPRKNASAPKNHTPAFLAGPAGDEISRNCDSPAAADGTRAASPDRQVLRDRPSASRIHKAVQVVAVRNSNNRVNHAQGVQPRR